MKSNPKHSQEFVEHFHFDKDIESALLGICLLETRRYGEIRGVLTPNCFYLDAHRMVFEAIEEMWRKNLSIDCFTVVNFIYRQGKTLPGVDSAPYFITKLTNAVVSGAHAQKHAWHLKEMFIERELIRIRHSTSDTDKDGLAKITALQEELDKLAAANISDDWTDMNENVMGLMNHMASVEDKEIIGAPSGFSAFDVMTSGFQDGTLTVLGARPSVGKTALLTGMLVHQGMLGLTAGVISLETPRVRLTARMAAQISNIEFFRFFRNRFVDEVQRAEAHAYLAQLATLPIHISDNVEVTIDDIRAKAANLIYKHKCKIIYVDYLQLVDTDETNKMVNREQQVSRISRGCKKLSMLFGIPIILLAQLNREVEKTGDKKPQLHHLRESGSIEQDADNVVFLHRPWKVGILVDEQGNSTEFQAELIIAKWRDGETGSIEIGFDGPKMKFHDINNDLTPQYATRPNPWGPGGRLPHADD